MNPPENSRDWAARFEARQVLAAGALRLRPGVEAFGAGLFVWLRGNGADDALALALRKIPGATRFAVGPGGRLTSAGRRVPEGALPPGRWVPLREWLTPEPQPASLPGRPPPKVPLRLESSAEEREANILVTDLGTWTGWAARAPAVRLRPLAFSASADGRALIRGTPLPPIPGARHAEEGGIAVPCGFHLTPPVDASALRPLLGLGAGDVALFRPDGSFERLPATHFARATRSAARMTGEKNG